MSRPPLLSFRAAARNLLFIRAPNAQHKGAYAKRFARDVAAGILRALPLRMTVVLGRCVALANERFLAPARNDRRGGAVRCQSAEGGLESRCNARKRNSGDEY